MTPQDLKNSIFQLAMQGHLVAQDPDEGTGFSFLEQIRAQKRELIRNKKCKKEKAHERIELAEIPYDLPESWTWARLEWVCSKIVDGDHNPPKGVATKTEYLMLSAQNINFDRLVDLDKCRYLSKDVFDIVNERTNATKGDILLTAVGTLGRSCIFDGEMKACFQRSVSVLTTLINNKFLKLYFDSPYVQRFMITHSSATAQKGFYINKLQNLLIPIPPLEEQRRIVTKIEELMPLIHEYEQTWDLVRSLNESFPLTLEKSLIQCAVRGKLVPQDSSDGLAEDVISLATREKKTLELQHKIKKHKPLPQIRDEEVPFDIPPTWQWCRLGEISSYIESKVKVAASEIKPDDWSLDLEDIEKNTGRILNFYKSKDRKIVGEKTRFTKGQILYSKLRPYLKKILIAPNDGVCTPELVPFDMYGGIDPCYIVYVLKSPYVDSLINSITYGVKMPRVGTDTMANLLIPIPPLSEQKRIVFRLNEVLPLCGALNQLGC